MPHHFTPRLLVEVPGGVATTDDNVLYVWRPGEDGPALQTPAEGPPLDERLVVADSPVALKERGRFACAESGRESTSGAAVVQRGERRAQTAGMLARRRESGQQRG